MIGKIMSEAAHSIIGMFSAKPLGMEHDTSNFDFGSLLRSPEEQPHSSSAGNDIDTSDFEDVIVDEASPGPVQPWETTKVLPFLNHSFGSKIFGQDGTSQKIEQARTTLAQDGMINPDTLQRSGSTTFSADEKARQAAAGANLEILSPQANVTFRSQISENRVGDEIFPSSDKGLVKLQSLQSQMRSASDELLALPAKTSNSPLVTKGGEQGDVRSGLGQSGIRPSPQGLLPVAPTDLQKLANADGEFAESIKQDLQPIGKKPETLIEQQPLANSSAQLSARATIQKPVSFDMSAPQVAERLAAEIADISVNGGPKKFEINPRNLGRMEITFTTRGSTEIIEIHTEHRGAKDIIVQHGQLLQDILKSQGRDDLTFRVDVKENMFSSSKTDGGNLSQQENRDAREQQSSRSQRRQTGSSFDSATENDAAPDSSRYA